MVSLGGYRAVLILLLSFILSVHGYRGHSYSKTCPKAAWIIKDTVDKHFNRDRTLPAGIIRLLFHDCFVNGCDGSLLLESNPDGSETERMAGPNKDSARGFEVIEDAKRRLEEACPGVVSCADTLAIAARDSVVKMGGKHYNVPTGRYDGRYSSIDLANRNLPAPSFNVRELIGNFTSQGLSVQDMVVLSGAHTIGTSQCAFFGRSPFDRLNNFQNTGKADPTIHPAYVSQLRSSCKAGGSTRVELDKGSQFRFDNSYYKNLLHGKGLLTSDQVLAQSQTTSGIVSSLAYNPHQFASQFGNAMIKMGNIGWKTKHNGEIRKVCSRVN